MPTGAHTYDVAVLPGDGIGREVVDAALEVLDAAQEAHDVHLATEEHECGAQYYDETGREWAPGVEDACEDADAILLGAVGWPGVTREDGEIAGAGVVFGLRFGLDLYANVRPATLYPGVPHKVHGEFEEVWEPGLVDTVLVRENTEGLYTPARGQLRRGGASEVSVDNNVITRKGARRVIERAFEIAHDRDGCPDDGTSRVTCVDKANVLSGSKLFREVFDRVAEDNPTIEPDHAYVDAFTQWLVREPEYYDVCVTSNMLGDIVTDLAAVLQGGMGVAPAGNIGDDHAMFEPVHGSSPKHAGKDEVNPTATILASALMLDWLGREEGDDRLREAADAVEDAVKATLAEGPRTYDLGGNAGTSEVATAVAERVRQTT
jgi:3-isopropylmalate dehydrogenase